MPNVTFVIELFHLLFAESDRRQKDPLGAAMTAAGNQLVRHVII